MELYRFSAEIALTFDTGYDILNANKLLHPCDSTGRNRIIRRVLEKRRAKHTTGGVWLAVSFFVMYALDFQCNGNYVPIALSGRHPTGKEDIDPVIFKYFALYCIEKGDYASAGLYFSVK